MVALPITRETFIKGFDMIVDIEKKARPFFDFMNERQRIWQRRAMKRPWPWTEDEILRTYFFTNVYRELDRVTRELHARVDRMKPGPDKLFAIIMFRAFNLPETYDALVDYVRCGAFDARSAKKVLNARKAIGHTIFTGAYVISNGASTRPKIDVIVDSLVPLSKKREMIWDRIREMNTMRGTTELLATHKMMGMFNSYEVACDLRHQRGMLDEATDVMTWANIGPGARRGVNYLFSGKQKPHIFKGDASYIDVMRMLLNRAPKAIDKRAFLGMPPLEMREIEHTLCEFAKYMNAKTGQRRLKRKYHGRTE